MNVARSNLRIGLLLAGGLLFRGLIAAYLHPGFDEAYYFLYTLNLNWSYFDHPPLIALTTSFGPLLTGVVSQFTIRMGALGLHTLSLWLLYRTGVKLFGNRAGGMTLAIATLIPIFQLGFGVLTLPDNALMVFWSATLWVAAQEFFSSSKTYRPTARLALIGLLVGLACLGKYHGFALGFGLVVFCALSPDYRRVFTSPWLALGFGLFVVALLPVLLWNAQHDWISFTFQSSRAVPDRQFSLLQCLATGLLSIAYLFPTLGGPLWWAILKVIRTEVANAFTPRALEERWFKHLFIGCISLPIIFGFLIIGGYQAILPTWQMPGFWGATLWLGDLAARWHPRMVRRWLAGSGVAIAALLLVALAHVSAGVFQKPSSNAWFGGFLPVASDASTQMVDIQQLRQGFQQDPTLLQALQSADFVFSNQIFIAGQVGMAVRPLAPIPITCFSDDLRGFAFWSNAEDWVGKTALYITTATYQNEESATDPYRTYFQSFELLGEVPIYRGGQVVETFTVTQATDQLKPYPRPYGG